MRKLINIVTVGLVGLFSIFLNSSCTEYEAPDRIALDGFNSDSVISTAIHRKVLWINIDGAVGSIVEQKISQEGTIAKMLKHSKYSWIGLSDNRILSKTVNEDPVTWSTMLTGVIPEKHQVVDDSYVANVEYDPSNPDEKVIQYPNILHHIAENDPGNSTLCVTPWEKLNKNLLNVAQKTITTTNDVQTKEVVLNHLNTSDFNFTLVSFSGMLEAGKSKGFSANNADYITALQHIDGYIGEFLQAIEKRKNTFYEDWLVIVTSNHGGKADGSYGGNSEAERNTLGIFYYSHYDEQRMAGKRIYGAYIEASKSTAVVLDTVSSDIRYALGENSGFSMEIIMRMTPRKDGTYNGNNWDAIITKGNPGGVGWGLFRKNSTASFRIGEQGSSQSLEQAIAVFNDPQWHNYSFSITQMNQSRDWTIALDGKMASKGITTTRGVSTDTSPLRIGSNVPTPYYVSEIRLWKKSLTDNDITQQATLLDIPPTDGRFKDLLAYWKLNPNEVIDDSKPDTLVIKNQVANGLDLLYINLDKQDTRPIKEKAFVELPNTFPAYKTNGNLIMENTMVVPQILYWLNMSTNTVLDGIKFIDSYAYSEDWRDLPE